MKKLCTSVSKKVLKRKKEVHVIYYMRINLHKKYFVSTIWIKREGFKKSRISTDRTSIKGYFSLLKNITPIKAALALSL